MNNCQHCNDTLTNPRAKNCAACKDILDAAYKSGAYSTVTTAIAEAKAAGITGEQMREAMRNAMSAGVAQRHQRRDEQREYNERVQRERQAEQRRRQAFYAAHGYWPGQREESVQADLEEQAEFERAQRAAKRGVIDMTEDY